VDEHLSTCIAGRLYLRVVVTMIVIAAARVIIAIFIIHTLSISTTLALDISKPIVLAFIFKSPSTRGTFIDIFFQF